MIDQDTSCNELKAPFQIDVIETYVPANSTTDKIENRKRKAGNQQGTSNEKQERKSKCRKLFDEMDNPSTKREMYSERKPLHDQYIKNPSDYAGFKREYLALKRTGKSRKSAMKDPESEEGRALLQEKEQRESWNEMYWEAKEKIPQFFQPRFNLFIKLNVNGISSFAFIDSGVNVSFIDYTFAQKCGLESYIDKRTTTVVHGLGGSELMIGTIYLCCVEIGQVSFDAKFSVWNDKYEITLGMNFIRYNRCSIDMSRNRLCFGENVYAEFLSEAEVVQISTKWKNYNHHSFKIDEHMLAELIKMGFSNEDAVNALERCANDLPKAVDYLYLKADKLIKGQEKENSQGEEKSASVCNDKLERYSLTCDEQAKCNQLFNGMSNLSTKAKVYFVWQPLHDHYLKNPSDYEAFEREYAVFILQKCKIEEKGNNSILDVEHAFRQEQIRFETCNKLYYEAKKKVPEYFLPASKLFVRIAVNGVSTIALIDTGADQSLMDYSFAEKCGLEHKIDRRKSTTMNGIAGSVKTIGAIYLCSFEILCTEFRSRCYVSNGPHDLTIGLDFLRHHKWHLDLPKNRIYFNEQNYVELLSDNEMERNGRKLNGLTDHSTKNDSEKLADLIEMGFDKDDAANALQIHNNDSACALRFLYKQII